MGNKHNKFNDVLSYHDKKNILESVTIITIKSSKSKKYNGDIVFKVYLLDEKIVFTYEEMLHLRNDLDNSVNKQLINKFITSGMHISSNDYE